MAQPRGSGQQAMGAVVKGHLKCSGAHLSRVVEQLGSLLEQEGRSFFLAMGAAVKGHLNCSGAHLSSCGVAGKLAGARGKELLLVGALDGQDSPPLDQASNQGEHQLQGTPRGGMLINRASFKLLVHCLVEVVDQGRSNGVTNGRLSSSHYGSHATGLEEYSRHKKAY